MSCSQCHLWFLSGQIDCADSIDEFYCQSLELNECDPETEYRCRQGNCIPLESAFDSYIDCSDASDEYRGLDNGNDVYAPNFHCDDYELPLCSEYFCGSNAFPCGDGRCSHQLWTEPICTTQDDVRFIQGILSTSKSERESCWTFSICQLGFVHFFARLNPSICARSTCQQAMFFFPAQYFIAHPSVRFIYQTRRNLSSVRIQPDYVCFDTNKCTDHSWPIIIQMNQTCISWFNLLNMTYSKSQWNELVISIRQIFARCSLPKPAETSVESLFDCGQSYFISKHRLNDGHRDCFDGSDELEERNVCTLHLHNRFQCRTDATKCIPRLFLFDRRNDCSDGSDEHFSYTCITGGFHDVCKWKRVSLHVRQLFDFTHLCDGVVDYTSDNVTDEENCFHLWEDVCDSPWSRCDGRWNCRDGHDELACPVIHSNPCSENETFFCISRTTGQMMCYDSKLAGDDDEDCVGGNRWAYRWLLPN